jgi:predicted transcriptional regulator of viral defense system
MSSETIKSLPKHVDNLQRKGRYTFTLDDLLPGFGGSRSALRLVLNRLIHKGRIMSVHRGFYVIVPLEYQASGILPADQFIDDLMNHLGKPYYVGLLSAAALHGAAYQRPQEFYVITVSPNMRPLRKKGIKINFISKSTFPDSGIEDKKTVTGYFKLSNPALTAYDIVSFEKRTGGIDRVAEILAELSERIQPDDFRLYQEINVSVTVIQRMGYLFEKVVGFEELSNALYDQIGHLIHYPTVLSTLRPKSGFPSNNRWKIIENSSIELEI